MKHAWTFGQQVMLPVISGRSVKETLIDYDGPQLRILEKGLDQFVALRIDDDGQAVRWLEAPITSVEYAALMSGELPLRNTLLKSDVVLVENSHREEPIRAWELNPKQIPDPVLPKRGASLPRFARARYKSDLEPGTPAEFHFSTKGMRGSRMAFSRLSQITSTIQNLWDSIASGLGAQSLTLNAVGFAGGSFKIRVEVQDRALLARVANAYRDLTRATYSDADNFVDVLSKSSVNITQSYSHYLRTLDLNRLDVLAHWHDEDGERGAFVGYAGAENSRQAIKLAPKEEPKRMTVMLNGYLEGFARQKKYFEFVEEETSKVITGKIQKNLRDVPLHDEVRLGHKRRYRVEIESVLAPNSEEKFTLVAFSVLD
jgi:hypothetical protein